MAAAKFTVGQRVSVVGSKPAVTGVVTQAKLQSNGWVYEVRLDANAKALPTYLEDQIQALGGGMKNLALDIRFREGREGVGYVTITLQGEQVVQSFTPPEKGLAFIADYINGIRDGVAQQESRKTARPFFGKDEEMPGGPTACDDREYGGQ